jgi:hypothetical protein
MTAGRCAVRIRLEVDRRDVEDLRRVLPPEGGRRAGSQEHEQLFLVVIQDGGSRERPSSGRGYRTGAQCTRKHCRAAEMAASDAAFLLASNRYDARQGTRLVISLPRRSLWRRRVCRNRWSGCHLRAARYGGQGSRTQRLLLNPNPGSRVPNPGAVTSPVSRATDTAGRLRA